MGRKITVSVLLDPEDFAALCDLSKETGISLSGLIRQTVKKELKRRVDRK